MRLTLATLLFAAPLAAMAQPAPSGPPPAPTRGVITRDQFVQRAATMAGQRFDAIDVNHTGSITRAQLRAWRESQRAPADGRTAASPQ